MEALDYNPVHPPSIYLWERTEGKMLLIKRLLKSVVFIGKISDPQRRTFVPYGTGFLFSVFHDDIRFDYVVTCHHVIESIEGDAVWVRLNVKDDKGGAQFVELNIPKHAQSIRVEKSSWICDSKQDIAVLSQEIGDLADVTRIVEKDVITKNNIFALHGGILPGEITWLVGLFTSHYGITHNLPIIRLGNIAALPEELIFTETGYVKAYLVETRSIGGLSGSPVFINKGSGYWPNTSEDERIASLFLGMMRGRLNTQDANDVVAGDSIADTINSGMGVVIPSEDIMNFINKPEFDEQRKKTVEQLKKKSHFRPTAAIPVADNPQHKEDFNSLLTAATKKKPPADET